MAAPHQPPLQPLDPAARRPGENFATGLWLLDSAGRAERRRRALSLRDEDLRAALAAPGPVEGAPARPGTVPAENLRGRAWRGVSLVRLSYG